MSASGICCPKCEASELERVRMDRGLEIDRCPGCDGVWLDRSEVYAFVDRPSQAYEEFKAACQGMRPTAIPCPRCGQAMLQVSLGADLPFEACSRCAGNWFDKGEVQRLCAYLDEKWSSSGGTGERPRVSIGPRAPTERELACWLGPDEAPRQTALAAAASTGLAALLVEPARTAPWLAGLGTFFFLGWYWFLSRRRRYISGARVVAGEIGSYADEVADEIEARVLFTYEDYPFQITRIIRYQSPLDVGAGGLLNVLVNPSDPRGAFIAARDAEDAQGLWGEEDRRLRMSPDSPFAGESLRGAGPAPVLVLRFLFAAVGLYGLNEMLTGDDLRRVRGFQLILVGLVGMLSARQGMMLAFGRRLLRRRPRPLWKRR